MKNSPWAGVKFAQNKALMIVSEGKPRASISMISILIQISISTGETKPREDR
jgi:hypothetical protein